MVLDLFAPACVLINNRYEILYFQGPTHNYLAQPTGPPTVDLLACSREGLRTKLRGALHRATQQDQTVILTGVRIKRGDEYHPARITITPLQAPREVAGLLLIAFEDQPEYPPAAGLESTSSDDSVIRALEDELKSTKEDLQGSIEQLESANEELKSANEEVMSMNEELQSINEELETSKEELQSLNEELTTVNNQLEAKIGELEATNDDLSNLLVSTKLATIFLDEQYRIRRFTPATTNLFNLIPADLGRPLSDISSRFTDPDLLLDAQNVLRKLTPIEREVQTQDERWYIRHVLPYHTEDNRIAGVVITFSEVTAQKRAEQNLLKVNEDLEDRVQQRTLQLETLNQQLRQENADRKRAELLLREREARIRAIEKEVLETSTREQQRISRDLHDRVGQELTGLGYLAASLFERAGDAPSGRARQENRQRDRACRG